MLVLSRREGERIAIGDDIIVTVMRIEGGRVRLGIKAPDHVRIQRTELLDRVSPAPLTSADDSEQICVESPFFSECP
jgi:carbon storage regulator